MKSIQSKQWQKVRIGDVCTITKGVTGIQKAVAGEYPMVTLAEERTTHNEFQFDCEAVIVPLVSSTGHGHASMKRVHYQEGKFAIGSILCAVVPNDTDFLNPKYLHIYLSYLKDKLLVPLMRGAANVSLSISNIKTVEVIVPPVERQLEIIELEKVLRSQKEKLDEQNTFQKSHLTLLRQQILQDAISGKLTADWRAENQNVEPASKLLEQIKAEKEKLIVEKKIRKEKVLPPISEDKMPFELPAGWEWCRLGEITEIIMGQSPSGDTYNQKEIGIPFFQGKKEFGDIYPIGNSTWCSEPKRLSTTNDILISVRAPVGDVNLSDKEYAIGRGLSIIRSFSKDNLNYWFLFYFLRAEQNNWKKKGSFFDSINRNIIEEKLIPLPPRAEQRAIVAKVERIMGYVSQLEEKIAQNATTAENLMQAFLGEAFSEK
jgi:type I restriction enzyme S subunit